MRMSVLWLNLGYTVKYSLSPREICQASPSGFPSCSGYISPYILCLVIIHIQYIHQTSTSTRTKHSRTPFHWVWVVPDFSASKSWTCIACDGMAGIHAGPDSTHAVESVSHRWNSWVTSWLPARSLGSSGQVPGHLFQCTGVSFTSSCVRRWTPHSGKSQKRLLGLYTSVASGPVLGPPTWVDSLLHEDGVPSTWGQQSLYMRLIVPLHEAGVPSTWGQRSLYMRMTVPLHNIDSPCTFTQGWQSLYTRLTGPLHNMDGFFKWGWQSLYVRLIVPLPEVDSPSTWFRRWRLHQGLHCNSKAWWLWGNGEISWDLYC